MRTATAAVVTSVVTIAIGGMIAFCRADGPAPRPASDATDVALDRIASPGAPTLDSEEGSSPAPTRRWRAPEPEPRPVDQPSALAEELSAIRDRVGSAVPHDWEVFGAPLESSERSRFVETVEALEANDPGAASPSADPPTQETNPPEAFPAALPPALADSAPDPGFGIPFKASPFEPAWEGYGMPGPPATFPPLPGFLPPNPGNLPFESPEALEELSKLVSATARDLERLAHVREEQRRYEEADRLRRLATKLRRENRRIVADAGANTGNSQGGLGRR